MAKSKNIDPKADDTEDVVLEAVAPSAIVPRITFMHASADFGFKIEANTVLSFADPGHQRIIRQLIERVPGAKVDFVSSDPDADARAIASSKVQAQAVINRAGKALQEFEDRRKAEITSLISDRAILIDQANTESQNLPGDTDEIRLAAFLATDVGKQLTAKKTAIEARVTAVRALIDSARAGTDSTLQICIAWNDIIEAKQRLNELNKASAGAAPVSTGTGPATSSGAASA